MNFFGYRVDWLLDTRDAEIESVPGVPLRPLQFDGIKGSKYGRDMQKVQEFAKITCHWACQCLNYG